jgi:hypothetical protein
MNRISLIVVGVLLSVFAVVALAAPVDQGAPGKFGPWPVKIIGSGDSGVGATVEGIDGGYPATVTGVAYAPAATVTDAGAEADACTTCGDSDCTTLLASVDILTYPRVVVTVTNTGDTNPLTTGIICFSDDNSHWEDWNTTELAALAVGAQKSIQFTENSRHYVKVVGKSTLGTYTQASVTASK